MNLDLDHIKFKNNRITTEAQMQQHVERLIIDRLSFEDMFRIIIRYRPEAQTEIYETNQQCAFALLLTPYLPVVHVSASQLNARSRSGPFSMFDDQFNWCHNPEKAMSQEIGIRIEEFYVSMLETCLRRYQRPRQSFNVPITVGFTFIQR